MQLVSLSAQQTSIAIQDDVIDRAHAAVQLQKALKAVGIGLLNKVCAAGDFVSPSCIAG